MRDPATINAICWMIRNRKQVASIPDYCGGEAGLEAAIRRACVDGGVAFDEDTERMLFDDDRKRHVPDWKALGEIVKVFCIAEEKPCQ